MGSKPSFFSIFSRSFTGTCTSSYSTQTGTSPAIGHALLWHTQVSGVARGMCPIYMFEMLARQKQPASAGIMHRCEDLPTA